MQGAVPGTGQETTVQGRRHGPGFPSTPCGREISEERTNAQVYITEWRWSEERDGCPEGELIIKLQSGVYKTPPWDHMIWPTPPAQMAL